MAEGKQKSERAFGGFSIVAILLIVCICLVAYITIPHIFRAGTKPHYNSCITNLRRIEDAKQQWALDLDKRASDTPAWDDIKRYYGHGNDPQPVCPGGGIYTLGAVSSFPSCSIPGHILKQ
jgi:hypothetical protein